MLKTRRFGYDGKGQAWIRSRRRGATPPGTRSARQPAVAEAAIDFAAEFSVILARWADGDATPSGTRPTTSIDDGILRRSTVPAGDADRRARSTRRATRPRRIAEALDHVGVLTVEFFACADGPVVNEIAPRVHNSGHWTIEGAVTSQFEQHIRAICGLPLGSTGAGRAAARRWTI